MRRTLVVFALFVTLPVCAADPSGASAAFAPATLLSRSPQLQFDEADSPAIASEGGFVAFRGSIDGVAGIYRRDLSSGEVAPVAIANAADPAISAPEAAAPSISADGRYIAFTSTADLDPADEPTVDAGCPQVYVRDMSVPWEQAEENPERAFTLASAVNGGSEALTYAPSCPAGSASSLPIAGAQAAPSVALSADGRKVAFTVLSASNLAGECTAAPLPTCATEPAQVAVRDLDDRTTTLVSVTPSGAPTPGGGTFPSTQSLQLLGGEEIPVEGTEPTASSAAISGDGTTVAWQGTNVPTQVPSASDVAAGMAGLGGVGLEVEPLWRLVEGSGARTTQRLLAGAGVNFYFTHSHESPGTLPDEGGALAPSHGAFLPPALSADGQTVAVLSNGPTSTNEQSYEFAKISPQPPPAELYAVHVYDDPNISPQVTPLTATPSYVIGNSAFDGVTDVAISSSGDQVAFNTRRVNFALPQPTLVSPPASEVAYDYTYEADLTLDTLQRVTTTYEGSPPDGEPGQLSLDGDGRTLALASAAGNLFYGDATPGVSQVYLTNDVEPAEQLAPQIIGAPPTLALPTPSWVLSATASPLRDGSVLVYAQVPGPGRLSVSATAQLPKSARRKVAKALRGRQSRAGRSSLKSPPPTRTVAQATGAAVRPSELRLRLRVGTAYRALVASRTGLYTLLRVSFAAAGHPKLTQVIPVTLRGAPTRAARVLARGSAPHRKAGTGAVK
jgi:hypothetical protein